MIPKQEGSTLDKFIVNYARVGVPAGMKLFRRQPAGIAVVRIEAIRFECVKSLREERPLDLSGGMHALFRRAELGVDPGRYFDAVVAEKLTLLLNTRVVRPEKLPALSTSEIPCPGTMYLDEEGVQYMPVICSRRVGIYRVEVRPMHQGILGNRWQLALIL